MHIFRPGPEGTSHEPATSEEADQSPPEEAAQEATDGELAVGDLVAWHRTDPYEGGEVIEHGVVLGLDGNDARVAWFAHESVEFPASELVRVGRV